LSTVFQKLGVHSQAELIALLRQDSQGPSGLRQSGDLTPERPPAERRPEARAET
jgi:hypothetical protein